MVSPSPVPAAMTAAYQEQGNSLKLVLPSGDIDFIVSLPVSDAEATDTLAFMGHTFPLEATEEILAKKLFYRAKYFQPRDVFDFAIDRDRSSAARALAAAAANRELLTCRIEQLSRLPVDRLAEGIVPLGDFSRIVPGMIAAALEFTRSAEIR